MSSKSSISTWIPAIARIGLVAKGTVYCLLGLIAFLAAFHIGGFSNQNGNKKGVFDAVQNLPGGNVILVIIILGLLCYCCWRGVQTFGDSEDKGKNVKGIGSRLRYFSSGLVYLSFAFIAAKVLMNKAGSGGGGNNQMIGELMSKPAGEIMVGIVAAIIAGTGIYQGYYGLFGKYKKHVDTLQLERTASTSLLKAGTIGYVSRGIVWLIIAYLMLKAALHHNSNEAGDTSKAFGFLQSNSYGSYLLAVLGIGFVLYGVFNFIRARYEHFKH